MGQRLSPPLIAIALALAGCGGTSAVNAGRRTSEHGTLTCALAAEYTSLAGLRRAASTVAVFRPTGQTTVGGTDSIPFTISQVKIVKTVAGRRLPLTLGLQQLGSTSVVSDCAPLVSKSDVYLAYLVPFRLRRTGPPVERQYVVVGAGGLFRHAGGRSWADPSARSFLRMGAGATSLPSRISILEAQRS